VLVRLKRCLSGFSRIFQQFRQLIGAPEIRIGYCLSLEWQSTAMSHVPEKLGNRVDRAITELMAVYLHDALIFVSKWSSMTRMLV
jgi:hypothetical protein